MQFVFPDCLGKVSEAIAYKCFKFNWFDFHWVKKDEMQYHWEVVAYEATYVPGGHVSAFVSRAPSPPSRHRLTIGWRRKFFYFTIHNEIIMICIELQM